MNIQESYKIAWETFYNTLEKDRQDIDWCVKACKSFDGCYGFLFQPSDGTLMAGIGYSCVEKDGSITYLSPVFNTQRYKRGVIIPVESIIQSHR